MTQEEQNKLVLDNKKLVIKIAKGYAKSREILEELIGEGTIGLVRASKKFDPDKGVPFSSFAWIYINNEIKDFLKKHDRNTISFDSVFSSDGLLLSETLADHKTMNAEQNMIRMELSGALAKGIEQLHPREAWIMRRYYGLDGFEPMTMQEIGEYIGVSKQYINQLHKESLDFLKNYLKKSA